MARIIDWNHFRREILAKHDVSDTGEGEGEEEIIGQVPTKDSATQDVAQDVIKFLESLMDG